MLSYQLYCKLYIMSISLPQTIVLIISLVFQGAIADAGTCDMPMEPSMSEDHASMDDHSHHDMVMDNDQVKEDNCCGDNCECLMFSCQLVFSIHNRSLNLHQFKSQLFDFTSSSISLGIKTSIYRPPIFA